MRVGGRQIIRILSDVSFHYWGNSLWLGRRQNILSYFALEGSQCQESRNPTQTDFLASNVKEQFVTDWVKLLGICFYFGYTSRARSQEIQERQDLWLDMSSLSSLSYEHGFAGMVITSRVSGRGNIFGSVRVSVCLSVCLCLLRLHYAPLQWYMGVLCTIGAQYAPPRRNMHHGAQGRLYFLSACTLQAEPLISIMTCLDVFSIRTMWQHILHHILHRQYAQVERFYSHTMLYLKESCPVKWCKRFFLPDIFYNLCWAKEVSALGCGNSFMLQHAHV